MFLKSDEHGSGSKTAEGGVHAECWIQSEERLEAAVFSGSVFNVQAQEGAAGGYGKKWESGKGLTRRKDQETRR